jgi:hypothetical protein
MEKKGIPWEQEMAYLYSMDTDAITNSPRKQQLHPPLVHVTSTQRGNTKAGAVSIPAWDASLARLSNKGLVSHLSCPTSSYFRFAHCDGITNASLCGEVDISYAVVQQH